MSLLVVLLLPAAAAWASSEAALPAAHRVGAIAYVNA